MKLIADKAQDELGIAVMYSSFGSKYPYHNACAREAFGNATVDKTEKCKRGLGEVLLRVIVDPIKDYDCYHCGGHLEELPKPKVLTGRQTPNPDEDITIRIRDSHNDDDDDIEEDYPFAEDDDPNW